MKVIDPNYEPPVQEGFTKYPDGTYKFKGLIWTSKSGTGRPCLKKQKDDKMTGRLKWLLEDGKQGPHQNLELSQMALIRRLLGLKEVPLPSMHDAEAVAKYMEELEKAATSKVIEASVKDGWVNIKGMDVPPGYFRFYLSRVSELRDGEFGKFFFVDFTVTAGEGGSSTPYKGMSFTEIYNYAVKVVDGKPTWETTESGQPTASAARLSTLIRLTAPEYASQDIHPADPYNILPEWIEEALRVKKILKGSRIETTNQKGVKRVSLVQQTLQPDYEDQYSEPAVTSTNGKVTPKDILVKMMTDKMGSPAVVADQLTPAGKKFATKYFKPLKDAKLLTNTSFLMLTDQEVFQIIKLVVQGNEDIEGDFLYEADYNKVNEMVNGIIKDTENQDVPWTEEVEEEENPFS